MPIKISNIKPLPGHMIVKLESLYNDTELIKVPERYKTASHIVGRIMAISMRPEDQRALGIELEIGNRIIVTSLGGRHLSDDTWVYPITLQRKDERGRKYRDSGVLAIIPDNVDLSAHSQAIERCQFCSDANPGVHQNMIMFEGVCPRCGKDKHGEIPDKSVKLTDKDLEMYAQRASRANNSALKINENKLK